MERIELKFINCYLTFVEVVQICIAIFEFEHQGTNVNTFYFCLNLTKPKQTD